MSGTVAALCLLLQDPLQTQIDEALRQFEAAAEVDRALTLLSSQLLALGARATNPIARRLAEDLRDGMASAAAPAFIDALVGRPDALVPLQSAFRDAATSASGRIELAEALLHLDDAMSWRAGLLMIASDEGSAVGDRLHAAKVLLEAEDSRIPDILRTMVEKLPGRPEEEQQRVAAFLTAANTPLTRELLAEMADARRGTDEPRVRIIDETSRRPVPPPARPPPKKKETGRETFLTMPSILAGGVTLLLLVLLAVEILRKG
ncbi:MAG: hypothetical protein HY293_16765 [Planctomycetes bacterium]|nr:hypothetical protein [Planctomycetota bacterium]